MMHQLMHLFSLGMHSVSVVEVCRGDGVKAQMLPFLQGTDLGCLGPFDRRENLVIDGYAPLLITFWKGHSENLANEN